MMLSTMQSLGDSRNIWQIDTNTQQEKERKLLTTGTTETLSSAQPLSSKGFSPRRKQNQFPVLSDFSAAARPAISICRHS